MDKRVQCSQCQSIRSMIHSSLCIALTVVSAYELSYLLLVPRCVHVQFTRISTGTSLFADIIIRAHMLFPRFYCSRLPCSSSCWSLFVICCFRCWIKLVIRILPPFLPTSVCIMGSSGISYSYTSITNCNRNKALGSWGELLGLQSDQ